PGDARPHLVALLESSPNDGELEHLLGVCDEAGKTYAKAAEWFARAVRHAPQKVDSYLRLAALLRGGLGKPKEAAKVLDQMVAANGSSFRAYLERARFRKETGATDGWEKDVRAAVKLAP